MRKYSRLEEKSNPSMTKSFQYTFHRTRGVVWNIQRSFFNDEFQKLKVRKGFRLQRYDYRTFIEKQTWYFLFFKKGRTHTISRMECRCPYASENGEGAPAFPRHAVQMSHPHFIAAIASCYEIKARAIGEWFLFPHAFVWHSTKR